MASGFRRAITSDGFRLSNWIAVCRTSARSRYSFGTFTSAAIAADVNVPKEYRSEEHTSELQSLMRISYAVFCLKKKKQHTSNTTKFKSRNHTITIANESLNQT